MSALLNIAAKSAAILATGATLYDVHYLGKREASVKKESNYADDYIAQNIGANKLNYPSPKNNAIKNFFMDMKIPYQPSELWDSVTGYATGALKGVAHNAATLGFAALTFCAKGNGTKKLGMLGLGVSLAYDFIKNGTNLLERTDYLRK